MIATALAILEATVPAGTPSTEAISSLVKPS
jgi:hypothetical protein